MFITFDDKQIYVETHGEGEPLVLLNGIMMLTMSWIPFIDVLSKNNKLILIDLLDQGQSSRMAEDYSVSLQADVLNNVLDALSIEKAHIAGISYGASTAMHFAIKYPQRVEKLVLFNCTAYTSPWLKDAGEAWKAARISPEIYYNTTIPVIYSIDFYNRKLDWINLRKQFLIANVFNNPDFLDAMDRLTDSHSMHDVRESLCKIQAKTLVVGSREDLLMPLSNQKFIADNIPDAELVAVEGCGHATMYEKPNCFTALITGFINNKAVTV